MTDYKKLIDNLKYLADTVRYPIINELHAGSLMEDAADAIERLVADNESYRCAFADLHNEIANYCETIVALEKERDAAVADLKECVFRTTEECHYCQHNFAETAAEHCLDCDGNSEWEWRGVKGDEDEAH